MTVYQVSFETWAGGHIQVETDETDPERIVEAAYEEGIPGLCAGCSGWGRDHSLELGDEWEVVKREDGTPYIRTADGAEYHAPEEKADG